MTKYIIYSLNLAAFLMLTTKIVPDTELNSANGMVYFLFPDTENIRFLVQIYKNNEVSVDLHSYLNTYKEIRSMVADTKKVR